MTRLHWDGVGEKIYEIGIDRGVLYTESVPGVPWNGLVSVDEKPSGGAAQPYYLDGQKYLNIPAAEEFEATIEAFTYPDEFGICDGTAAIRTGFFAHQQRRVPFGFAYRTLVGNDILRSAFAYKLHLVYNALAVPSDRSYTTSKDSQDPTNFSWDITTLPNDIPGFKSTAFLVIDSREFPPATLSALESILYGTDADDPRLPLADEIATLYDTIG